MSRLFVLLPLLAACVDDAKPVDTTEDEPAPLADPYVSFFAATAPGYLRSDCSLGIELFVDGTDTLVSSVSMDAQGGEWTGFAVETGAQYTAEASWSECTTVTSTGTGSFTTNAFSGVAGDLFVFRYNGESGAFDALTQRTDYEGGIALITFVDTSTSAEVDALADAIGVDATLVSTEAKQYEITWDDTTSVAAVLAAFSADDLYLDGEPVWIRVPTWW